MDSTPTPGRDEGPFEDRGAPRGGAGSRSVRLRAAAVMGAALVYTLALSFFSVRAHQGLQTQMNDLGNADQVLWLAAHGDWAMRQSNALDGRIRSHFGIHANLIFLPLSLLYRIRPEPALLLVLGSLACAAAGLGLFALARRRLGDSRWCLVPPLAFYASPLVHDANLYDFHCVTLATAFLVWTVWSFATRRPALAWVLLVLALLCKEDMPLVGMMLGLCYLLGGRRRRGLAVLLASALYFALVMGVLAPLLNEGALVETIEGPASRYAWILEDPLSVPAALLRPDRLRLPLYFLLAGAAAAWRGRRWLLLLAPPLAMGMLSRLEWNTRLTGTYYWLTAAAVIAIACIHASRGSVRQARVPRPLVYLAAATAVLSLMFSPLPHGMGAWWANYHVGGDREALREIARRIPAGAALSVQNNLGPHLSHRPDVAAFPRRLDTADRVLLQLRYLGGPDSGCFVRTSPRFMFGMEMPRLAHWARRLARDPDWGLVAGREGFYLFARGETGRIPPAEALVMIDSDVEAMAAQYRLARRFRSPLARWLVGPVSWTDLFGGMGAGGDSGPEKRP